MKRIGNKTYRLQKVSPTNVSIDILGKRILLNDRKAKHRLREYLRSKRYALNRYCSIYKFNPLPPLLFIIETYYQDVRTMTEESGMYCEFNSCIKKKTRNSFAKIFEFFSEKSRNFISWLVTIKMPAKFVPSQKGTNLLQDEDGYRYRIFREINSGKIISYR